MSKYHDEIKSTETIDENGNITTTTTRVTKQIRDRDEPDYIKLYTKMWCEFNRVPEKWRTLFFALVCRMSYASLAPNANGGQVVYTVGQIANTIAKECGWKTTDPLYRGLKALCECEAIRKLGRGVYQINPQYAGRGPWRYNAATERGGVKDLIAKFSFADGTVDTEIVYASTAKTEIGQGAGELVATRVTKTRAPTPTVEWCEDAAVNGGETDKERMCTDGENDD